MRQSTMVFYNLHQKSSTVTVTVYWSTQSQASPDKREGFITPLIVVRSKTAATTLNHHSYVSISLGEHQNELGIRVLSAI